MLRLALRIQKASFSTVGTRSSLAQPWYVSENTRERPPHLDISEDKRHQLLPRPLPVHLFAQAPDPPKDAPQHLLDLHHHFSQSPFIDTSRLLITRPPEQPLGPMPHYAPPRGKRRRGAVYAGEGIDIGLEPSNGIWRWFMLVQVKEGTEGRGAIGYVVKSARSLLLEKHPHIRLPPKSRTRNLKHDWFFLDAGDTGLHILSKLARETWFSELYNDVVSGEGLTLPEGTPPTYRSQAHYR